MPPDTAAPSREDHEVVVLGGGPAGCAAAALLRSLGHDVALVRPPEPPAGDLAESIPPSARAILLELGMLEPLQRRGFHRNGGNTVRWAGADARVEAFEVGVSGFHADRRGLEEALASVVEASGARVYRATARAADDSESGWRVRCRAATGADLDLVTPWLLDATGRTGVVARAHGRRADPDTNTLALVRRWKRAGGFDSVDPTHTVVESYVDGWAWSVPLDAEVRCMTAMVDPRHTDLSAVDLDASLDAELEKAGYLGALRRDARPLGPTWACPASLYSTEVFGRRGLLLVGDAGSFIDPLSSFGVKKALSSGWLAAVTVHTALADAAAERMAVDFFDRREREVYRRYRARSADFFEPCASAYAHEYWERRAASARAAAAGEPGPEDPDAWGAEIPAAAARAALERIRARPSLDAVPARSLRTVERPTVRGHRIVRVEHLASDRVPAGLRWVRNVDLDRLVHVAPRHPDVPDGWAAYNAGAPAVPLPDYLVALATAFAAGLLEHGDD